MGRLDGKTALVTGAARGLGEAIARKFAAEGATVFVNDVSLDAARQVADEISGHAVAADVSDSGAVTAMFAEVADTAGRLDILVNNAGISGGEGRNAVEQTIEKRQQQAREIAAGGPIETFLDTALGVTDDAWRRMQAIHVDGTFFCCREALRIMSPQMSGSIINMGSVLGTLGRPGNVPYSTAKAAILGLTRALAHDVAPRDIRVNTITPGWIETDMTAPLKTMHPALIAQTPLHRLGEPDDIAWAAVYLASDESTFVTGQSLSPNGGWYMSQ